MHFASASPRRGRGGRPAPPWPAQCRGGFWHGTAWHGTAWCGSQCGSGSWCSGGSQFSSTSRPSGGSQHTTAGPGPGVLDYQGRVSRISVAADPVSLQGHRFSFSFKANVCFCAIPWRAAAAFAEEAFKHLSAASRAGFSPLLINAAAMFYPSPGNPWLSGEWRSPPGALVPRWPRSGRAGGRNARDPGLSPPHKQSSGVFAGDSRALLVRRLWSCHQVTSWLILIGAGGPSPRGAALRAGRCRGCARLRCLLPTSPSSLLPFPNAVLDGIRNLTACAR